MQSWSQTDSLYISHASSTSPSDNCTVTGLKTIWYQAALFCVSIRLFYSNLLRFQFIVFSEFPLLFLTYLGGTLTIFMII